jgi:hypothetical protein
MKKLSAILFIIAITLLIYGLCMIFFVVKGTDKELLLSIMGSFFIVSCGLFIDSYSDVYHSAEMKYKRKIRIKSSIIACVLSFGTFVIIWLKY